MGSIQLLLGLAIVLCSTIGTQGDFLGRLCGTNWGVDHSYPAGGTKVRDCIAHCHADNYKYAGMIFGYECFCDNTLNNYPLCRDTNTSVPCLADDCSRSHGIPCNADDTMICGDTTWYSLYDADANHNTIWHWDTVVNDVCSRDQNPCNWTCHVSDVEYKFPLGFVYGTDDYDIQSSFCLASAHDLRYIPNEETLVSVVRHQTGQFNMLEGSWRYGIQSTWKLTNYTFDVTAPPQNYDFEDAILWGFANLSTGVRTLNCEKFGSPTPSVFASTVIHADLQTETTNLPLMDQDLYYCALEVGVSRIPATYVPVVTEPSGNGGVVNYRTITVNEKTNVTIKFDTSALHDGPWVVEKAKYNLTRGNGNTVTYPLAYVDVPDAGFYYLKNSAGSISGTIRLIVVNATDDLNQCGGIFGFPREDGTCMCFPPFGNATNNCTGICNFHNPDGSFGPNCDQKCGDKTGQCKGLLVCGEDPFGCHCSSGWMGPQCDQKCPNGTFGPDCKGNNSGCHCIDGEGCGHITGLCPYGCIWGWFEDDCKKEGAYMKVAPIVVHEEYDELTVDWKAWNISVDGGTINPDGYYLEYKLCSASDDMFANVTSDPYPAGHPLYSVRVENLLASTCYSFRVRTSVKKQAQPIPSPVANGTTVCGSPTGALQNFDAKLLQRQINITWTWPEKKEWNCNETEIFCEWVTTLTCSGIRISANISKSATGNGSYADSIVLDLPDFSSTDLTCCLTNNRGFSEDGPKSHEYDITPLAKTPGMVSDLSGLDLAEGLLLVWSHPPGEAGQVMGYNLAVTNTNVNTTLTKGSFLFERASLNQEYEVIVTARNRYGDGVPTMATFRYEL